jgi:hypothetical protein
MREGFDPDKAKRALLAEGFADKALGGIASNTPASKLCYPQQKEHRRNTKDGKKGLVGDICTSKQQLS